MLKNHEPVARGSGDLHRAAASLTEVPANNEEVAASTSVDWPGVAVQFVVGVRRAIACEQNLVARNC